MKNTNWQKLVSVFVDPSLRGIDKELYQFVAYQFQKEGFSVFESSTAGLNKALGTIKIIPADPLKVTLDCEAQITITLRDKNMNLFAGNTFVDENDFSFHDEREFYDILPVIRLYIKEKIKGQKGQILEHGISFFKQSCAPRKLKEMTISKAQMKLLENIENRLYLALDFNELNTVLETFKEKIGKQFILGDAYCIYEQSYKLYFPLESYDEQEYFIFADSEDISLFDLYIYQSLVSASERLRIKREGIDVLSELEEIFSKINIPIAVFDKKQHLVLHNAEFVNLNISAKKVIGLKVNDQVTIGKEVYKVQKVFLLDGAFIHVNFIPVREFLGQTGSPSSEELGIVSSSIAHELNNPLGGILAALNVIELDEHSAETMEKIAQMREGVLRCKKLVETFLGFSKIKPAMAGDYLNLRECFNQAMDLVRFRLIENNIIFNSEYISDTSFKKEVNPYVISMIFYLFFGEVLTTYSHQKLVTHKNSPKINLNFMEKNDSFEFELLDDFKISESFVQSKLIQHLLETQGLHMAHEGNKCRFF